MGHWVEKSGWQLLGVTSAFWSTPTRTKWTSGVNDTDLKPNGVQISQPASIKRAKTSMIIRERLYCLAESERFSSSGIRPRWFTIFSCLERSSGRGGGVGGNFSNPLLPLCFIEFNSAWNTRRFARWKCAAAGPDRCCLFSALACEEFDGDVEVLSEVHCARRHGGVAVLDVHAQQSVRRAWKWSVKRLLFRVTCQQRKFIASTRLFIFARSKHAYANTQRTPSLCKYCIWRRRNKRLNLIYRMEIFFNL